MTVKDLYKWAKSWNIEEYTLIMSYRVYEKPKKVSEFYVMHETREVKMFVPDGKEGNIMTIRELYEWAKESGIEDYALVTPYEVFGKVETLFETYIIDQTREVQINCV